MTLDLAKILNSKRKFRQCLADRPIEEKLAMLDALRERELTIRSARTVPKAGVLREKPPPYQTQGKKSK